MAPITKAGAKKASARKQRRDKALPLSKSRKAYFDAAYAAVDTGDLLATVPALAKLLREHPEAAALMRVKQALQDLHLDPTVHHGSYELTRFVGLMRELITDAMPGMTLEQILEPLRTLLSQHGGGRPTKRDRRRIERIRGR